MKNKFIDTVGKEANIKNIEKHFLLKPYILSYNLNKNGFEFILEYRLKDLSSIEISKQMNFDSFKIVRAKKPFLEQFFCEMKGDMRSAIKDIKRMNAEHKEVVDHAS